MKRIFGAFILLFGVLLAGWLAYNYLVEMRPAAQGRNPIPAILLSLASIYVGTRWLQNKIAH